MPRIEDIEQFAFSLSELGREKEILSERGETLEAVPIPEQGLSADLSELFKGIEGLEQEGGQAPEVEEPFGISSFEEKPEIGEVPEETGGLQEEKLFEEGGVEDKEFGEISQEEISLPDEFFFEPPAEEEGKEAVEEVAAEIPPVEVGMGEEVEVKPEEEERVEEEIPEEESSPPVEVGEAEEQETFSFEEFEEPSFKPSTQEETIEEGIAPPSPSVSA
ncbi:MAG: hypothetical protein SNJ78_10985, partial [Spirochaetales bacterium]